VLLEGLGQLKIPMTLSGIEPATFRLVAYNNDDDNNNDNNNNNIK
jgi:hypothetical protein